MRTAAARVHCSLVSVVVPAAVVAGPGTCLSSATMFIFSVRETTVDTQLLALAAEASDATQLPLPVSLCH